MTSFVIRTLFTASVPLLLRTSVATVRFAFNRKPAVTENELREKLAMLDLRAKLDLYETVLQDIRDTTGATDMLSVALTNVQDLLFKMKELLTIVETNLRIGGNGNDIFDFLHVSRTWYDRNEEEMIDKLQLYDTLLATRYDALISTLQLQLRVRDTIGLTDSRIPVEL